MYKCGFCNKDTTPRQPLNKVVTEKRNKTYTIRYTHGKKKGQTEDIHGWEIAKELPACPGCYQEKTGLEPTRAVTVQMSDLKDKYKSDFRPRKRKKSWKNPRGRSPSSRTDNKKAPVVQKVRNLRKSNDRKL